ncbi:hypothetical protein NL533_29775, partial [Klebsiella pneumoniae]|nr:hypothetical protein [Klebsiella pneumoniae]
MDGLLQDLRDMLDEALDAERAALFPDPSDDARFREAVLDNVPDDVGRAIKELNEYDWRSPQARELFEQIKGTMPPSGIGTLTDDNYSALVAFILR